MALTILENLDSGYDVRCRLVPPYAVHDALKSIPRPKYPMLKLKSEAGPSEIAPALEESEEWYAWKDAQDEYNLRIGDEIEKFTLTYGVYDYRKSGSDDAWTRGAPKGWKPDPLMHRYGVEDSDDKYERWYRFIRYELIMSDEDEARVDVAIGNTTKSNTAPISQEELDDALVPFYSPSE